jgi:chitinase
VATAVKVGRLKDLARVQAFLQQGAVDLAVLKDVLERHQLMGYWLNFCAKAQIENPLGTT